MTIPSKPGRLHTVKVPDELWEAAALAAAARDETVSQVIRRALTEYATNSNSRKTNARRKS